MNTTSHSIANKIYKPVNNINKTALENTLLASGLVIAEEFNEPVPRDSFMYPDTMNLLEFSRMYKLGQIPIIDFIIGYIFLYIINSIWTKYDYKLILIITVPLVIIFNLLLNPDVKLSIGLGIILVVSIYFLLTRKYVHN